MVKINKADSGLTVATAELPHSESVCLGVWAGVGGRYEPGPLQGVSHFIEHMFFKGTAGRNARQISEAVEGVGGYINAYTCEDHTCIYAKSHRKQWPLVLEVLLDMYVGSSFEPAEMEKERAVIQEELAMDLDQPQDYVHELLHEVLWPNHPLGRNLTGTRKTLAKLERDQMLAFRTAHYVTENTFLIAAGHIQHQEFQKAVAKWERSFARGARPTFVPAEQAMPGPRVRHLKRRAAQTQLALGILACSRHDPRRFALKLLNTMLGENMSSRLFQAVREDEGLTYSIHSSLSLYEDTGAITVAAGLDAPKLGQAFRLILRELKRLTSTMPTARELQRARDYVVGQMALNLEGTESQMMWVGEQLLGYGKVVSQSWIEEQLMAVSPSQIRRLAVDLYRPERMRVALISPECDSKSLEKLLSSF
ncbi:MAG: Peptidase domain protein [Verrucomicrobiales bacterium]|nr:Peptidase domain protein [Verrucomicrobiales bacterium]